MNDSQFFHGIWYLALLLMLLPLILPLARSKRAGMRQAAVWVLIGGFLVAFYRIGEWLLSATG